MLALHCKPRNESRGFHLSLLVCVCLFVFIFFSPRLHAQQMRSNPSSFTSRLINQEATAKETFRFNATLHNGRPRSGIYELQAAAPDGWNTVFRVDGMQLTTFRLDSNKTQDIS